MKWHFQTHNGWDDINQSSSHEAFSGGVIRDLATALVREGVQNVLDARAESANAGPVRIRITLGTAQGSPAVTNNRWFGNLFPHLRHPDVGAPEKPSPHETCDFLAFEDFNTKGLVGDFRSPYRPGGENNFVNFMYHDGITWKPDAKLGSRGVGKIVFTMASRARVIFAFTIREDDPARQPLLVGKNLLKFREVDEQRYTSRSYFLADWPKDGPREPVTDVASIRQFTQDFPLARKGEPGLSIVVPFLDPTVTADLLRSAIVCEYHYAILAGELEIELDNRGSLEKFSADHLPSVADADMNARVELTKWAVSQGQCEHQLATPEPNKLQRLTETLVPDAVRNSISEALNHKRKVSVRVPLYIHPKSGDPLLAYFNVYLEAVDRLHEKPVFIRELLPVSDVREAKPAPQVRALVIIPKGPLADLLRAAEGANHTDWSPRTDKFQERYKGRLGEISFVATAVQKIVEIARGQANEPVGGIATQFFSAALPKSQSTAASKAKIKPGAESEDVPDDLEPNPGASYIMTKNEDGFTIRHNPGRPLPKRLTVRVAYDVLRGTGWSQYDPLDFDLRKTRGDIRVLTTSADVTRSAPGNRLIVVPQDETFEITVSGFDPNRDLIVDVRDTTNSRKRKEADLGNTADQLHEPQAADA